MAWRVYQPKRRKPKTTYGWSMPPVRTVPRPRSFTPFAITPREKQIRGLSGPGPISPVNTPNAIPGNDPYPSFYDPYGGMLAQLAAERDRQAGQLQGNLTGREAAINKLYADQQPLADTNYNQAIKSSAAVNDAVTNQLKGEGATAQADLLSRLSMIGAPQGATDEAANQVKNYYSGLGGANYAMDAGDVQRLIGQLAETKTYLSKQPGIIAQQLESEYAQAISDLMSQFNTQSLDIQGQRGQAQSDYAMNKFQYETSAKQAAQEKKDSADQAAEDRYWDNYWKQRDSAEKRYELAVATRNKKSQLKAQKEMKDLDRKKDVDIANIRSGTSITTANIRAEQSNINSQRAAAAKTNPKSKPPSANTQRAAYKAAYQSVVTPTGTVKFLAHYGNARVIKEINTAMKIAGIDPNSEIGKTIRKQVLSSISGKRVESGGQKKYQGAKFTWP